MKIFLFLVRFISKKIVIERKYESFFMIEYRLYNMIFIKVYFSKIYLKRCYKFNLDLCDYFSVYCWYE